MNQTSHLNLLGLLSAVYILNTNTVHSIPSLPTESFPAIKRARGHEDTSLSTAFILSQGRVDSSIL